MKKIILFLLASAILYGHDLILDILDNKNNTITVKGSLSTHEDTPGALVQLESLINGNILYRKRLPISSELTIEIPKEPYQVVLDANDHIVVKQGIAPLEGFSSDLLNKKLTIPKDYDEDLNMQMIIFFVICLFMFILAIYFSNKNTKKILEKLNK